MHFLDANRANSVTVNAKNICQKIHGVNFDDKCPHGDPFYACMSCSH